MPAKIISPQEGFQQRFSRSNADICFGGGVLNPQPLTSHILTPKGFIPFSELKTGDEVCGLNNTIQTVTHCDLEGEKECIRITLEDGSSAESALDHKWWILKEGNEMTAISFEILESFQICQDNNSHYEVSIFRLVDGIPVPFLISNVEEIGMREVACVGVSNEDQLYITDDYLITKNCGKAQPITAKVLTPFGWVYMGDLKEGDTICNTKGGTQKVLKVYEKGKRDVYEVTFFDGGSTRCCHEHLWCVYDNKLKAVRTMTLQEIMMEDPRDYMVQCIKPANFFNMSPELSIDPYTLGRMLGKQTPYSTDFSKSLRTRMELLGMADRLFIPDRYKFGSVSERKDIMKGFIDEAVKVHPGKDILSVCVELRDELVSDIQELTWSLGGTMHIKRTGHTKTRVHITLPQLEDYFTNKPKEKVTTNYVVRRQFSTIRKVGYERCRCILVSDYNHLYITDDYIPTHNTFAAVLTVAEPTLDSHFRGAFTRRNLGNLKQGGGIIDEFEQAYDNYIKTTTSENPRVSFPSGAYIDCLHIADETPSKLMERAKGWQYDFFYMDELTSYEFSTFRIVGTRCRGSAVWSGHVFGTTNPKRSHWTRKMLDRYIGPDGFIIPEMDGVVMYYYLNGETIDDVIMGSTKEEVYARCKMAIDRQLKKLGGAGWTYRDIIKSFVFYAGRMSENKASIGSNSGYIGSVAAVGGKRAQQLIEGNFNVDEDEEDEIPISSRSAQNVFVNDECRNGDKWITVDLADVGTDNVIALSWDGFHVDDILIIESSTPRLNAQKIKMFASKHNVPDSHVIYDGTHGSYMYDYMPEANAFVSASSSAGLYALLADRLKDECYLRLVNVIERGGMSVSEEVGRSLYHHQKIKEEHTVQEEFLEECSVVRFVEKPNGKKKLLSKKEMNARLGRGRSMDLLDPCAMRMLPVLQYQYGDELSLTSNTPEAEKARNEGSIDIYDPTFWI